MCAGSDGGDDEESNTSKRGLPILDHPSRSRSRSASVPGPSVMEAPASSDHFAELTGSPSIVAPGPSPAPLPDPTGSAPARSPSTAGAAGADATADSLNRVNSPPLAPPRDQDQTPFAMVGSPLPPPVSQPPSGVPGHAHGHGHSRTSSMSSYVEMLSGPLRPSKKKDHQRWKCHILPDLGIAGEQHCLCVLQNMHVVVYIHRVYKWYIRYVYTLHGRPPAKTKSQK